MTLTPNEHGNNNRYRKPDRVQSCIQDIVLVIACGVGIFYLFSYVLGEV